MSPRLAKAVEIAVQGAKTTLPHFASGVVREHKQDGSPVTVADREAEATIRRLLNEAFPGESVLGEEEGGDESRPDRWVCDPIDGTKSFIAGVPLYSTLLSYEVDRAPVLGVVVFPALGQTFYAERGHGAFLNDSPCHVSDIETPALATISCAGHTGMDKHGYAPAWSRLAEGVMTSRTWCDAYGHMLVASGRAEAMFDPIVSRWDLSAVVPIVLEAGGSVTNADGSPLNLQTDAAQFQLLSTNQAFHRRVVEELSR